MFVNRKGYKDYRKIVAQKYSNVSLDKEKPFVSGVKVNS